MSFEVAALIGAWLVLLLFGLALAGVVRQIHTLAGGTVADLRLGPQIGESTTSIKELGLDVGGFVLLFVDAECESCGVLLENTAPWTLSQIPVVLAFRGRKRETAHLDELLVLEHASDVFERLRVPLVPYAVAVDRSGVVQDSAPIGSARSLETFIGRNGNLAMEHL